jgi:hypothetical protein
MTIEDFVVGAKADLGDFVRETGLVLYSFSKTLRPGEAYLLGVNPGGRGFVDQHHFGRSGPASDSDDREGLASESLSSEPLPKLPFPSRGPTAPLEPATGIRHPAARRG